MIARAIAGLPLVLVLLVPGGAPAQQVERVPHLEWAECPFVTDGLDLERIRCGYLSVPENRADPEHRTIRLALAVARAKTPGTHRDAILYLAGGPGYGDLGPGLIGPGAEFFATDRDFVVVDLRGSGYSDPALCPDLADTVDAIMALDLSLEEARRRDREAVLACRNTLQDAGIDLGSYNAPAMAADIEDLRQALGYAQWNLFGVSYGTLIAQAVMRGTPASVRSVVMNAPVPIGGASETLRVPHFAQALHRVAATCAAQASCAAAFPGLEAEFHATYASLQEAPLTVAANPARFSPATFTVNAADFVEIVHAMLFRDASLPYIPAVIHAVAQRDTAAVRAVIEQQYGGGGRMSAGLYYATTCHDRYAPGARAAWTEAAAPFPVALRSLIYREGEVCDAFHADRMTDVERSPVTSEIPTLIRSGPFDPVTPPALGDAILRTLPNGYHVVFPDASHNVSPPRVFCLVQLMQAFWAHPEQRPAHECVEGTRGLTFALEVPH
ncbi:MAG: alpha/beta fold hydrolase [Gemmatimonadetes bacterium]|nr:alpha/beta fold hydrolase [Gemmatimonadota bacterium]